MWDPLPESGEFPNETVNTRTAPSFLAPQLPSIIAPLLPHSPIPEHSYI